MILGGTQYAKLTGRCGVPAGRGHSRLIVRRRGPLATYWSGAPEWSTCYRGNQFVYVTPCPRHGPLVALARGDRTAACSLRRGGRSLGGVARCPKGVSLGRRTAGVAGPAEVGPATEVLPAGELAPGVGEIQFVESGILVRMPVGEGAHQTPSDMPISAWASVKASRRLAPAGQPGRVAPSRRRWRCRVPEARQQTSTLRPMYSRERRTLIDDDVRV